MLRKALIGSWAAAAAMSLAACEIRVARDQDHRPTDVDVNTPLGDLSVTTDAVPEDVGVALYPGARPLQDSNGSDRANLWLDSPFVELRVAALKYTSEAAPEAVAEFYRRELATYGPVTMCRGDLDFDRVAETGGVPRCKRGRHNSQVQVGVGTKGNFRLASVKPRGSGSEFAVVYVRAASDL
jgi:hypothetical protein